VLILALLAFGMLVGWLAQIALGMTAKPDGRTLIAGVAGSFVGGTLSSLIVDGDLDIHASGLIGSFIGAVIVLAVWRAWYNRSSG
jgi:uncharacterized membrane protein YeaQ/YmgE (transglycosylase-associated protein family)